LTFNALQLDSAYEALILVGQPIGFGCCRRTHRLSPKECMGGCGNGTNHDLKPQ